MGASGVPFGPTAMAAAAWSWVEKMLQEAQRTWAPRATRVSISTAVCTVMCSEPVMRAPHERLRGGVLLADRHQTGHLVLGERDLLAAELREGEVGDLEVLSIGDRRHNGLLLVMGLRVGSWLCDGGHSNARALAAQSVGGPLSLARSAGAERPTAISSDV